MLTARLMLKPLSELLERDSRYQDMLVPDGQGGIRYIELADHYADIAALDLVASAPAEVRAIFDRARHIYIFAWFDYELTPVATMQAFAALESALRHRGLAPKQKGLRGLLEEAVKLKLVPKDWNGPITLPQAIAEMRNHWAHGSDHFPMPRMALDVIQLVGELINRLYR